MLSLLNLNRKQNREEIYTVTKITGEQWRDVQSSSQTDPILRTGGQAVVHLFDKSVAYSKPLVDIITYKKMTKEDKAQHCTLNTTNTYIVNGEIDESEVRLEQLRESRRVYKLNAVEPHTRGSILVRHIRLLMK